MKFQGLSDSCEVVQSTETKRRAFISGLNATVLDLSNMLSVTTSRSPFDFLNYGNWCGLGGSGYPLDSIDR
ncbi:hypothetical protein AVEN_133530-1 [Araneus ventricosus]|uniref:Uncharacterized protein n=1 Tax=Araneus ventricosus TaxID=182803 RepID=A0A4Y2M0N9_ARAVE|nr:hypothetical protein AVEN_133530-1 [Araneus ventricosus]